MAHGRIAGAADGFPGRMNKNIPWLNRINTVFRIAEATARRPRHGPTFGPPAIPMEGIVMHILLIAIAAALALPFPAHGQDLKHRFERLEASYFPFWEQLPERYTCELRSPELVASMDEKGREAWGNGHIRLEVAPGSLKMTAEDIANPGARGIFNLLLGLWQIKAGADLRVLQAHLQNLTVATQLFALTSPFTHEVFERRESGGLRLGMTARNANHGVQELGLLVSDQYEIREFLLRNNKGGRIQARLSNERGPLTCNRWVFDTVFLRIEKPGKTEVLKIDFDYTGVGSHVMHSRVAIRREDGDGHLLFNKPNDVNPVSYLFGNYRPR